MRHCTRNVCCNAAAGIMSCFPHPHGCAQLRLRSGQGPRARRDLMGVVGNADRNAAARRACEVRAKVGRTYTPLLLMHHRMYLYDHMIKLHDNTARLQIKQRICELLCVNVVTGPVQLVGTIVFAGCA